jgi:hypothetical protein
LIRFGEQPDGVQAVLKRPDGSEEICAAVYLAGCDGAHSTVRQVLGIDFPGGTYSGLFYVADVEASGPATDYELHLDLDLADILIVFPMKGTGCVRLVGTVSGEHASREHDLTFDDVSTRAIENVKLAIAKVNWFSTYRVHHRVANSFGRGRAYLLGDAAHVHSPVGGQGMNTGIGDAVNLAWKLAAVIKGNAGGSLLDTYEPERIGFARRLVATTDRLFTAVTSPGRIARFVRTGVVPRVAPLAFRFPQVRRFLFRTVSQIGIEYRKSALSTGAASTVRGGDRLPWVEIGPHEDNFGPLSSLGWQVHLYGEPRREIADDCARLGLPLHTFGWVPAMERAGLARGTLYLIRPDGYVALADPDSNPERLTGYFTSRGISAAERTS